MLPLLKKSTPIDIPLLKKSTPIDIPNSNRTRTKSYNERNSRSLTSIAHNERNSRSLTSISLKTESRSLPPKLPVLKPYIKNNPKNYVKKSYIISIAINEYSDPQFSNLISPVNDSEKLISTLEKKGFTVFIRLYNKLATYENICKSFDDIAKIQAGRIIVYFGCHGFLEKVMINDKCSVKIPYFALSHTKKSLPRSTAFPMETIKFLSKSLSCKHQCFIIDACYAGSILHQYRSNLATDLLLRRSCTALCSSSQNQVSLDDNNGSILISEFTHILNSYVFNDDYVTLNFLVDLLQKKVYEKSSAIGFSQLTQFGSLSVHNEGSMLFFKNKQDNQPSVFRPQSV